MESPAFIAELLIPSGCWLLGLFAMRKMDRTRKDWLSALSLIFTVALMIALLLWRLVAPWTAFRWTAKAALRAVTLTLCGGVGIFLRAWSLYVRDRLPAREIGPYWLSGFLILCGAVTAFHVCCFR